MTRMTEHALRQRLRRTLREVAATVEADVSGGEPTRVLVVDDQQLFRRGLVMPVTGSRRPSSLPPPCPTSS
jgi:hypothetical protein